MTDYLHGYFSMCESPIGDVQVPIAYSNMPCVNIMSEDTCYLSHQQAKSQQATYIWAIVNLSHIVWRRLYIKKKDV